MTERGNLTPDQLERPDWNSLKENYTLHDIGEAYLTGRFDQIGVAVEHWGIDKRNDDGEDGIIYDNKMDLRLWEPKSGQSYPPSDAPSVIEDGIVREQVVEAQPPPSEGAEGPFSIGDQFTTEEWEFRGICDVKTKSSVGWLGKFNLRHLVHYAEWSRLHDEPVFIYFTLVDADAGEVGDEQFVVPIEPFDRLDRYLEHYDRSSGEYIDTTRITEDCEYVRSTFGAGDGNAVVEIDPDHTEPFDWVVEEVL